MNLTGPRLPSSSGVMPGRAFFSIASACIGMSGRVVASGAGDRSSVLVSPVTLNTVMVRLSGTSGRLKPFGVGPALQHGARVGVALVGEFLHIVELIEHQQRLLQRFCGGSAHFGVSQQFDQRLDVVAAQHRAEQLGGVGTRNQRAGGLALGYGGQEAGLHPGGFVHACGHAMGDQVDQGLLFASGRIGQQFDQFGGLLSRQRQRGIPSAARAAT